MIRIFSSVAVHKVSLNYTEYMVYDLNTKQATFLFDVKGGAEPFKVYGQFISWYGYPSDNMETDKMTILYDYKNRIRYLSDFHTIIMSEEGVDLTVSIKNMKKWNIAIKFFTLNGIMQSGRI